ncbi:hypothetical protein [Mycobacterium simiae]|uniref:hypothetical protein n=1 Tax=Mycobacterium simiae TaxID=1784 RepID=UPI002632AAA3|nr:hypothetical protein [Mycobacterium simiae]
MTVVLNTDDLEEAEHFLGESFGLRRLISRLRNTVNRALMIRAQAGTLAIDTAEFTYSFDYEVEPTQYIFLNRVYSGAINARTERGDAGVLAPKSVLAQGIHDTERFGGTVMRCRWDTVAPDRAILSQVASGPPSHDEEPVRLTATAPVSASANQLMIGALDHLRRSIPTMQHLPPSPLIIEAANRYLAACMLTAFPNTALLQPTIEDRHDSAPVLLRRAVAFIDDNAHRDISVTDIARAIYVTPRAVQLMFRKHRDCPPHRIPASSPFAPRPSRPHRRQPHVHHRGHRGHPMGFRAPWPFRDLLPPALRPKPAHHPPRSRLGERQKHDSGTFPATRHPGIPIYLEGGHEQIHRSPDRLRGRGR